MPHYIYPSFESPLVCAQAGGDGDYYEGEYDAGYEEAGGDYYDGGEGGYGDEGYDVGQEEPSAGKRGIGGWFKKQPAAIEW